MSERPTRWPTRRVPAPAAAPGATVGVLAPASPVREEWLGRGEAELARLGFSVRRGPNLLARARYTAGDPEARAADLRALLEDDDVEAVFCARGGYGCMDLLDLISGEELRNRPRLLLGSSDATVLLALWERAGLVALHGPMVAQQIARGPAAYDDVELLGLLSARTPGFRLPWRDAGFLHPGAAEGVLRGGCLTLLAALVGTPFAPSFRGAIAVFEDIGVKPYQIDRMLAQLRLAGALDGVAGIVFGQMPDCVQHENQGYSTSGLLADLTRRFGVPVVFGFATGHVAEGRCRTLPLGVRARMDADGIMLLEPVAS